MGRKLCKKASRGIARKIEPAVVAGFPIIMYTLCFEAEKHVTTSIPPPPRPPSSRHPISIDAAIFQTLKAY